MNKTNFIKLLDEIFDDFESFVKARDNKSGNSRPRNGIKKLAEYINDAKDNSCQIQNEFHESLEALGDIAENHDFNKRFESSLSSFEKSLNRTIKCYQELKKSLVTNE